MKRSTPGQRLAGWVILSILVAGIIAMVLLRRTDVTTPHAAVDRTSPPVERDDVRQVADLDADPTANSRSAAIDAAAHAQESAERAQTILVAGTVRDANGVTLTGALITVEPADWDDPEGVLTPQLRARTDADGRFEFRETKPWPRLSVTANHFNAVRPEARRAEIGDRQADFVLHLGAAFAMRVELPGEEPLHGLEIEVLRQGDTGELARMVTLPDGTVSDGRIEGENAVDARFVKEPGRLALECTLNGIEPGVCSVQVGIQGDPTPLVVIEGVAVGAVPVVNDPRLHPIDLRNVLAIRTLTITGPGGKPTLSGDVVVSHRGGPAGSRWVRFEQGKARFYVRNLPADMAVSAPGCLTQQLVGVIADQEVVLTAGIAVRVTLGGAFETKEVRVALVRPDKVPPGENGFVIDVENADELMLARLAAATGLPWFDAGVFDEHRVARVTVPGPGEYVVCCYRGSPVAGSKKLMIRALASVEPERFTVREGGWEAAFTLRLDPAELR